MAKRIASAVGTEMQFMPQPDATYQERLTEVQGVRGTNPSSSSASMFASAANNLNSSWLSFITDREKRMNEEGLTEANRLIASTTEKDRQKLNTLDMALTYGYGNNLDNPYFIAYSDKLRGQALGDSAKLAYTEEFGDNPARTPDEEVKRYDSFVQKYRQRFIDKGLIDNNVSFEQGFNDKNIENQQTLMSNHVQRDIEDRISETFNNIKSELGNLIYDAPTMTRDEQVQKLTEIFNQSRLMGLNPSQRQTLVDNFTKEIITTGTIKDFKNFKATILDRIPVQTRLDGTTQTMGDLVDTMELDTLNLAYRKAHMEKSKMDFLKKYGKDKDMNRVYTDAIKMTNSGNRDERDQGELLTGMFGPIESLQNQHKAAQARMAKVGAKGVTTAAKSQASTASAMENIRAFMEDDNPVKDGYGSSIGKPLVGGKAVDSGTILSAFQDYENQIIDSDADEDTKAQKLMKLYTYSGVSNVKEQLVNSVLQTINSATADSVEANGVPNSIIYLVKARNINHGQFAGAFGSKVDAAIGAIVNFSHASGEEDADNALVRGYANYCRIKDTSEQDKQNYMAQIKGIAAGGWSIGGMDSWNSEGSTAPDISWDNPQISETVKDRALMYNLAYHDPQAALDAACNDVRDSYAYYHGAVFPKNCFNSGLSPDTERAFAKQSLDALCYQFADNWGVSADDINVSYDEASNTWSFSESANGNYTQLSGSDMANEIQYVASYVPPSTSSSDESSDYSYTTSYTSEHTASDFVSTTAEAVKDKVEEVEDAVSEKWNEFKSWVKGE
ncbi:hypothetical protein [uncultured Megasphaera sp.]|uniref:hypothetical protein n=1 Tax=uncultured Megasphaera sp. TaxID=165188 RepID=UPI00259A3657|nr:hypothetical protein [uncultured Megasphaera sp.]